MEELTNVIFLSLFYPAGFNNANLRSAEIYNSNSNTFVMVPSSYPNSVYGICSVMSHTRQKVYNMGGVAGGRNFVRAVVIYDLATSTFQRLKGM